MTFPPSSLAASGPFLALMLALAPQSSAQLSFDLAKQGDSTRRETTNHSINLSTTFNQSVVLQTLSAQSVSTDTRLLGPGTTVGQELKSGDKHAYRISLNADEYVEVTIRQDRSGITAKAFSPAGRQLTQTIYERTTNRLFLVADNPGNYIVQLEVAEKMNLPSRYELKINEVRSATDEDRKRVLAQDLSIEAARLNKVGESGTGGPRIWEQVVQQSEQALRAFEALRDPVGLAEAMGALGEGYWLGGAKLRSVDYFERKLEIERQLADRWALRSTLNNLGVVSQSVGEPLKAIGYFQESLALSTADDALLLYNISVPYRDIGDYQKALDYQRQALALWTKTGISTAQAYVLRNMGTIYALLGDPQSARSHYDQALAAARAGQSPINEASALIMIGTLENSGGNPDAALENFTHALEIARSIGDRTGEAASLLRIGLSYDSKWQHEKALEFYQQAISLYRTSGDRVNEATVLQALGESYRMAHDLNKAAEYYQQALVLERTTANRNSEAETLFGLANVKRGQGLLEESRKDAAAAIDVVESLRAKIFGQDLRGSLVASRRPYYEFLTDLLMDMHKRDPTRGYDAEALQTTERGRARVLLETLAESHADIRQGVDPLLLDRERSLEQRLSAKSARLMQILSAKHDEGQEAAAKNEIEALVTEYRNVQSTIRATSPRYATITQPVALRLADIQRQLDDNTVLLEYALGDQKSFLWLVTNKSNRSFELPNRATIDAAARTVYELLTVRSKVVPNETAEQSQLRGKAADDKYRRAAAILSELILKPVAPELEKKRLVVVSDGALQYVPFAALPISRDDSTPLIAEHELTTLPSASVLTSLRTETARRVAPAKTVAVLADPVFSADDSRITSSTARRTAPAKSILADVFRSAEEAGLKEFLRLRFSRDEADAVTRFVPAGSKLRAVDFAANRQTATSAELNNYRILHFATHGLINSRHPELSGLVLSLVDEKGEPQDGFLRLYEIYNLGLRADLVVLSACQTALGKEIKGEGLIGLTRGFMYAGAPRVVASLWRVDDRATAQLMKRFYEAMLGQRKLTASAALRVAQLEMIRSGWESPAYWAAFTLQGEWR